MANMLKYFNQQIKKCADFRNENYYCVGIELSKGSEFQFRSYINGFGWITEGTMSECITETQKSVGIKKIRRNFSIPLDL